VSLVVLPSRDTWLRVILLNDMKRVLRYGRFGSFYGSWSGTSVGVLVALYVAADTLYRWPKDGTVSWFIGGVFSILLFSLIGGYILGFIGGFVFGLAGSFASNPLGWSISGVAGGFVSSWLAIWLLWSMIRKPAIPNFLSFWWSSLPACVLPCIILGVVGWVVGCAVHRGRPNIPRLDWIRGQ